MHTHRVFIEATGRRIQPFDDPIDETLIRNRPLSAWRASALAAAGLTPIEALDPPCLVLPDTALINAPALRAFLEGAAGRDAVFVLGRSRFAASTAPVHGPEIQEIEAGWRLSQIRYVTEAGAAPVDVIVDPLEHPVDFPAPRHYMGKDTIEMGIPRRYAMILEHWVHVLWANQFTGSLDMVETPPWRIALRFLWAAIKARSFNHWRVLAKLNRVGKGCDIHPTAVVEGCTLGDGVKIGPYARVLFSELGDGADVMPAAQVDVSVIGPGAVISEQCVVRFAVLYPGAVASQLLMQQCVLGRDAVTTKGSVSVDLNFDEDIRVPLDGRMRSTQMRFLGSAYGHRCRVGTGCFITPGRSIPNDYFLIRDPNSMLAIIPPGYAGVPLIANQRRAAPLKLIKHLK
ncbi:hypothetical protein KKF91_01240 [Myxococcota bacterium]|nr:hypothetical protein [Myxococcota bacterium]MBU1429160.1 hypothetical protein [Myxococcota bacterium]MBU1898789.1 hypothetical protein [Myxococcota bacterium]